MRFKIGDRAVIPEQNCSTFPGRKISPQPGEIIEFDEHEGVIYAEMRLDNGVYIISAPVELLEREVGL